MPLDFIQIPKSRLIEILNESDLYTGAHLNLDQSSHNARQIVAALSGMLVFDDEELANLLAQRVGLAPTYKTLQQTSQVTA